MALTQGLIALFAGHSTCQIFGPARVATAALCLAVATLPRLTIAAEPASLEVSPHRQIALIDKHIERHWEASDVVPSREADDGEFCRRVFLDLLGRIPSVDELERFFSDSTVERRGKLVDRLLGDAYIEEYALNWTTVWTNLLIGRSGGMDRRSLVNRAGLEQSLRRALQRNMPYDQMVHELIAAKGVSKPGEEDFNGFVNFLADKLQENAVQATAKSAQLFLGLQIQCTQCHNHPFNDWKQNQFWEMNAFFRQTRALRRFGEGRDIESIELVNQDFAGENNRPEEAVLFYELRNGLTKAAYPVFVDGTKLDSDSGFVEDVDRRGALADLMISSEYLAPALVNRMWAHFLGYGFTKPVDDMGPHNPPSHPELLAELAEEFRLNSYDLKQLMRWIVLSRPYGLSSRMTRRNEQDDPALGTRPLFSHFYLRQMRAEELYESLLVATEADRAATSYAEREANKRRWLEQFTLAFGTDDNAETTTFNGTIPQTLMMMNGDLVEKATSLEEGSFLDRLAGDTKRHRADKVTHLYLAALSRRPTRSEVALYGRLYRLRDGNEAQALQDLWWAVLNSNEFILNH
ncbi:MAG: DUF1549 domain-containing protein [Planctomycetota bacterium]|nr:MAG: DUF1549 domain-containing protein [Planctomycetota bacterium]